MRGDFVMGRLLAWTVAAVVGLALVGVLALALFKALIGMLFYIVVGAIVVGGGMYLYGRTRRALSPDSRARRRLDAAAETYRMRQH
jgi:hypothetical protein